jgi:hypothetical protein
MVNPESTHPGIPGIAAWLQLPLSALRVWNPLPVLTLIAIQRNASPQLQHT